MSKITAKTRGISLLEYLRQNNLDEYGSVILVENVRRVIGISYPETATKRVFDELALQELSAIDYTRNVLLDEGKYLAMSKKNYRILLPSENAGQIEAYMDAADRKLSRAMKLSKKTPSIDTSIQSNLNARLMMKTESLAENRRAQAIQQ